MRHFNKLIHTIFPHGKVQFFQPTNIRKISSFLDCFISKVADVPLTKGRKVTIFGAGDVGMACTFSILTQNICNEICLIDVNKDKAKGEMLDLRHGSNYLNYPRITSSSDYAASACSRLCIVTAGVRQKGDETRLSLVQRNADILKTIIPKLVENSPDTILLIATNPVDAMTYVAWKLSGLPMNRFIGSGTNVDSSRFRFLISQRLNVAATSCHGWIIGEHGETCVPVWSGVNVAGTRLRDWNPCVGTEEDPEKWNDLHKKVVKAGTEVRKLKGYTSYGIGLSVASMTHAILKNTNILDAVSISAKGEHCIDDDIFLSLPCVLNSNGVTASVKQVLTPTEAELLQKSADAVAKVQCGIKF